MNKVRATYKRLDYNNGDFLAHYQWRVMQDSVMFVWGLFQDDEDGMWTIRNLFLILFGWEILLMFFLYLVLQLQQRQIGMILLSDRTLCRLRIEFYIC